MRAGDHDRLGPDPRREGGAGQCQGQVVLSQEVAGGMPAVATSVASTTSVM